MGFFSRQAGLALVAAALMASPAMAAPGPWFGLTPPGPLSDPDQPTVPVGPPNFGPVRPDFPRAKDPTRALSGDKLMADVHTIIGFSKASREGGDAMWGRVSGTPAEIKTVEWAAAKFKAAGLDGRVETFPIEPTIWFPKTWEVRLLGSDALGAGSKDIVLQSAFPEPTAASTAAGGVTGPLIFVGRGLPAELANVDVRDKIAVLHVVLNDSLFDSRERGIAESLAKAGAVSVINVIDSPGNMHYVDTRYGCAEVPCYAVGGEDGAFLENLIGEAAKAGRTVSARVSLDSEIRGHLSAANAVAIIPGKSERAIIIGAHADGWFDGANDNSDGLATLVAEAAFFAKRGIKPEHSLIFIATAGHHNAGNGQAAFIKMHPEVIDKMFLMINLEHLAQLATVPSSPAPATVGFPGLPVATVTETPKQIGVSTGSKWLGDLFGRASSVYGMVTTATWSRAVPGDAGPYLRINKPAVQMISAATFYHSTGDVEGLISRPGLERAAAFYADFIDRVDHATDAQIAGTP